MSEETAKPLCDVCGLEPAVWGNRMLLGSDDKLCNVCFSLWYDEGLTTREEMRRRRHEEASSQPSPPSA